MRGEFKAADWDLTNPSWTPERASPTSTMVSPRCYGHTGFTGTCVWVDPTYKLVYVFLSNRVYPDAENKKLVQQNVYTEIQEAIYEAVNEIISKY